jgi:curved DNA-binding protein
MQDYYETLGVARDASDDDIKRAYRKLARRYHPDVSELDDAEEQFKALGEAYDCLRDADKRAAYDAYGPRWQDAMSAGVDPRAGPEGFHEGFGGYTGAGPSDPDFADLLDSLFGGNRGDGGGGWRRQGYHPGGFGAAGSTAYTVTGQVSLSIEEAYAGASRSFQVPVSADGAQKTLNVRIPPGVTDGERLNVRPKASGSDATPLELLLTIQIEPHRIFRSHGRDVTMELPIEPWEAALGATISVPTLGGKVNLRVPAGSQSGQQLRLKDRGLPGRKSKTGMSSPGDQLVVLKVVVPPADNSAMTEAYEKMRDASAASRFNPREALEA